MHLGFVISTPFLQSESMPFEIESEEKRDDAHPENWVANYGDYLYRYALSRLKNPDLAADCVQDTLLAGIEKLSTFDQSRDIKYWLRAIMRNKIVDHFRKQNKEKRVDIGDDVEILESALFKYSGIAQVFPESWKFDPRQYFNQKEFWTVFQKCVDELKEPARQAFVLKMLEDMSTEEICEILDISSNHLWVLLHRARQQLKSALEVHWKR